MLWSPQLSSTQGIGLTTAKLLLARWAHQQKFGSSNLPPPPIQESLAERDFLVLNDPYVSQTVVSRPDR